MYEDQILFSYLSLLILIRECYERVARQFTALYNSKQSLGCRVNVLPAQVLLIIMDIFYVGYAGQSLQHLSFKS